MKELPYAWDLNWDVKTIPQARKLYAKMKKNLEAIPKELALMEKLADESGFSLGS